MTKEILAECLVKREHAGTQSMCWFCAEDVSNQKPLYTFVNGIPVLVCDEACKVLLSINWAPQSQWMVR